MRTSLKWSIAHLILAVLSLQPVASAQGCQHWAEALIKSFMPPQVDEQALQEFTSLSPNEYFGIMAKKETGDIERVVQGQLVSIPDVEMRLQFALQRFYEEGSQLYGVRLDAQKLRVVRKADVNAFATGSSIFFHEGIIHYFPRYLIAVGVLPSNLTWQEQQSVNQNFGSGNDWDGIYFVLAHEASHNLMRHRDEQVFTNFGSMFADYRQGVLDYRKDLAEGKAGGRFKRYLWRSLENFLGQFGAAEKHRGMESEADLVALVLLKRTGFDPRSGFNAARKLQMLSGQRGGLTEVLCSTHPDWNLRIAKMQPALNCVLTSGNLCENHIPYPVESFLPEMRKNMDELQAYHQKTVSIAEILGTASGGPLYELRVETDPRDAILEINGTPDSSGTILLPVGKHRIAAYKEDYERQERTVVVFPDVRAKVKIKLKRQKR